MPAINNTRLSLRHHAFDLDFWDKIELTIDNNQIVGALQAIKYRYMLALMEERKYFETRSFLIAKSITTEMVDLCEKYDIECFIVNDDLR